MATSERIWSVVNNLHYSIPQGGRSEYKNWRRQRASHHDFTKKSKAGRNSQSHHVALCLRGEFDALSELARLNTLTDLHKHQWYTSWYYFGNYSACHKSGIKMNINGMFYVVPGCERTVFKVHDQSLYSGTLLHWAVVGGNLKCVQLLIELGSDPSALMLNCKNKLILGTTPIEVARANMWGEIVKFFESLPPSTRVRKSERTKEGVPNALPRRGGGFAHSSSSEDDEPISDHLLGSAFDPSQEAAPTMSSYSGYDGADPVICALVQASSDLAKLHSNGVTGVLLRNGTAVLYRSSGRLFVSSWVENSTNDLTLILGSYLPTPSASDVNADGYCAYSVFLNGAEYSFPYEIKVVDLADALEKEVEASQTFGYEHGFKLQSSTFAMNGLTFAVRRGTRGDGGVILIQLQMNDEEDEEEDSLPIALFLFFDAPNTFDEILERAKLVLEKNLPRLQEVDSAQKCTLL